VRRAIRLLDAQEKNASVQDTLILTHKQRRSQRARVVTTHSVEIELDLPEPVTLRTDDVLLLDTGEQVDVVAAPEPLMEIRAEVWTLTLAAWAFGDRHVPVQILSNRIRLHRDSALAMMAASLGCKIVDIEAPFEPEGGAYVVTDADRNHLHHRDHGHHHHHSHQGRGKDHHS
jgi:urease accessory protein